MKEKLPPIIAVICIIAVFLIIYRHTHDKINMEEEIDIDRNQLIYNGQSVTFDDYKITLLYEKKDNKSDSNYCEFLVTKNDGEDKLSAKEFRKANHGSSFCKRFNFNCEINNGSDFWGSRLEQEGNGVLVSSEFEVRYLEEGFAGLISVSDKNNINDDSKKFQMMSYLDFVNGKSDDETEVYIFNDSIQLISTKEIDIENVSIELLYNDGSKKELMQKGISEYLSGYKSIIDNKVKKYYYKWNVNGIEDIKNIARVNLSDDKETVLLNIEVQFYEKNIEKTNISYEKELINVCEAKLNDDLLTADTDIIYGDETTLIFMDYYGIIVYSLKENCVKASLDLEYIQCNNYKEDNCRIEISADGKSVYICPMLENVIYDYRWEEDILEKTNYDDFIMLEYNIYNKKEMNNNISADTNMVSKSCVKYDENKKLYLSCDGSTLQNLKWVIEDENGNKESGLIFKKDDF